jgi:hypothetical protein
MYRAKVLASMLAVAAIIVASSPLRAVAQDADQTKTTANQLAVPSDDVATMELSARSGSNAKGGGGGRSFSRSSGGGRSVGRSSGSSRSAGRRSSSGKSASGGGSKSKSTSSGGTGKSKSATGTGKTGTGTRTGKLGAGPGKTGTGTGKTATGTGTGTGKLGAGPGKTYREQMGPTNNTTPTNQNANNPAPPPKTTTDKGILVKQGKLPWIVKKGIDVGITSVVPIYGPLKGIYDTGAKLGPGISQTLENSKRSQEQHEKDKAAEIEAGKARQEQGGGFLGGGLNSIDMDP